MDSQEQKGEESSASTPASGIEKTNGLKEVKNEPKPSRDDLKGEESPAVEQSGKMKTEKKKPEKIGTSENLMNMGAKGTVSNNQLTVQEKSDMKEGGAGGKQKAKDDEKKGDVAPEAIKDKNNNNNNNDSSSNNNNNNNN